MAAQTDFWGEIGHADLRTPLAIMREQAALLGVKTKNLVEAVVTTSVELQQFVHRFELVVPSMSNYRYELFWVRHDIAMYPITVPPVSRDLPWDQEFKTEQQFTEWLRETLSSATTKRIIANLLAQATS